MNSVFKCLAAWLIVVAVGILLFAALLWPAAVMKGDSGAEPAPAPASCGGAAEAGISHKTTSGGQKTMFLPAAALSRNGPAVPGICGFVRKTRA